MLFTERQIKDPLSGLIRLQQLFVTSRHAFLRRGPPLYCVMWFEWLPHAIKNNDAYLINEYNYFQLIYLLINRIKNMRTPGQVSGPVIRSYPAPAVVCYVTPRFSPKRAALVLRHVVWVITSCINALRSTELSENLRHSSNNRRNLYVPFLQYWECFAIIRCQYESYSKWYKPVKLVN